MSSVSSSRRLRIVIPGGSGHIGQMLARHFLEQGHEVTLVSRHPLQGDWKSVVWNAYELGDWAQVFEGSDVVVNLAGRSVNCRYNAKNRREILTSRTISTAAVGKAIEQVSNPPWLWLNASTATIYTSSLDRAMDDLAEDIRTDSPGMPSHWQFSIDVATSWERALLAANVPKTRRVAMRTGLTMSPDSGGVFDAFLRLVRFGFGGKAGSGRQYVSWIHDVDFIRALEFLIHHDEIDGAVNICSPNPLANRKFMSCLRQTWCTSYVGLPSPEWLLKIGGVVLRTEPELLLKSRRVVPTRLINAGFDFHFPNWRGACQDLVARWREIHAN